MTPYEKIASCLLVLLIASLPFFSVRNAYLIISPPLFMSLLVIAVVGLRAILTMKLNIRVTKLDIGIFLYIALAVVSLMATPNVDGAKYAFFKTIVYFVAYVAMKILMDELRPEILETAIRRGVLTGTVLFGVIVAICLGMTGKYNLLLQKMNYSQTTIAIFSSIDSVLGSDRSDSFEGKNVMRNAVAEAFTFYFLATLVFQFKNLLIRNALLGVNLLFAVCMFSRRAFIGIVLGALGGTLFNQRGYRQGLAAIVIIGCITICSFAFQEQNRLADSSDGGRFEQVSEAIELFTDSPILGSGYAAKLERETYVHNFVFASAAMLGIPGLLLGLYIYTTTVFQYLLGIAKSQSYGSSILLVIPILGMTVGATVEGIFTITGWLVFAIHSVHSNKIEEINVAQYEYRSAA